MTGSIDFERKLERWLDADVASPAPQELLTTILADTSAVAPRAAWSARVGGAWSSLRGPAVRPSVGTDQRLVAAALVAMLVMALVASAVLIGSRPRFPAVVELPAVVEPSASATPGPIAEPVGEVPIQSPAGFPSSSPVPGQGVMTRVADMAEGRIEPAMVTLADGRVLIVGGMSGASAEIFDPATGRFTVTDPGSASGSGSGVLLQDGRVLVVLYDGNQLAASIHVFDPQAMSWTRIAAPGFEGSELDAGGARIRRYPTLTLLLDGRVLLSGGEVNSPGGGAGTVVDIAEFFDPVTETLSPAGSMVGPRVGHSATMLPDGRVLIAGGRGPCTVRNSLRGCDSQPDLQDAELYDPATGTFTPTGRMSGVSGTTEGLLLPEGRVLVVPMSNFEWDLGADGADRPGAAEIYDPGTGTFTVAAPTAHRVRTATLLPDGRVFLTTQWDPTATAEDPLQFTTWSGIFDPATGSTQDAPAPPAGWQQPALLGDGRILLVGGIAANGDATPWAELYEWR